MGHASGKVLKFHPWELQISKGSRGASESVRRLVKVSYKRAAVEMELIYAREILGRWIMVQILND